MFQLIPIAQTTIDWNTYLSKFYEISGRSATTTLDTKGVEFKKSLANYLSTLKEIDNPGSDPINQAGVLLEHISLSFLLIATKKVTINVLIKSRLPGVISITKHDDFDISIISGNLSQWRTAIINCCSADVSSSIRQFGSAIISHLEEIGLKPFVVGNLLQIEMSDGTFRLKSE